MDYKIILFDFDGVICKGRFYEKALLPDYTKIYNWIQENIFRNKILVQKWMRNHINSDDVNKLIAESTGIEYKPLKNLFEKSIHEMQLEKNVLDFVKLLKKSGMKVGIVTDNMDIFTQIIVPNNKLDKFFDVIINSADYGILKKDKNGKLFDIALRAIGEKIEDCLLIDDSESTIKLFGRKGGNGLFYSKLPKAISVFRES